MKSLQTNLKTIRDVLNTTSAAGRVYHYTRPASIKAPWIVWQEDGENASHSTDNRKDLQQIEGSIDCYTQTEFDTLLDEVQDTLNDAEIGFQLVMVDYEDETNLIHYQWRFYIA